MRVCAPVQASTQAGVGSLSRTDVPRVILSHGGVQYSYPLARALGELGVLERFFTTFRFSPDHWSARGLKVLPRKAREGVIHYLQRRAAVGLDEERVESCAWPEMLRRAGFVLAGGRPSAANRLIAWQNRMFDARVARRLPRFSFDVLIALSGSALQSIRAAKRMGKIAVIDQHDIHHRAAERLLAEERESSPDWSGTTTYWPPLRSYLDRLDEEFQSADYILVPSTFALQTHLEAGIPESKLILVHHGVEADYESLPRERVPDGKFRVLFAGQITQRKGVVYLLEAVRRIGRADIDLVLLGDLAPRADGLKEYEGCFRRVEYVEHGRLKSFFDRADVLVLPSIYDAYGLVAVEAMVAGLPVVVSENTAAGSDVVRDGVDGFVVPIRDADSIKDRLLRLKNDPDLARRMGESARARAREFGWSAYKEAVGEAVRRVNGAGGCA